MRLTLVNGALVTGTGTPVSWAGENPALYNPGNKTCQAWMTGTGAVSATIDVYASLDGLVYSKRFTISLSGTNSDSVMSELVSRATYWRADVTAISGTGAAVTVKMEV
jgi:hypothetical protein